MIYQANPLVDGIIIDKTIRVRFLSKTEIEEYQKRINEEYKNNKAALESLNVLSFDEKLNQPVGSNFFAAVKLEMMGKKVASLPTLEKLVNSDPESLKGNYVDVPALVLHSPRDPDYKENNIIINYLLPQLKNRAKGKIEYPVLIIGGMELVEADTPYGLNIKLTDNAVVYFDVKQLRYTHNNEQFKKLDERGVPIFNPQGTRYFTTRKEGLSRVCLTPRLGLSTGGANLARWARGGRIIICA